MKEYYGFVYLTTNIVNGKKYIGAHKGSEQDSYLGSGKLLKRAIKKHGIESFKRETLAFAYSDTDLFEKEKYFGKLHNVVEDDNYYNVSVCGFKNPVMLGKHNPFYGKNHSDKAKKKMSEFHSGKSISEETKEKISQSSKERWQSQEYRKKIITALTGRKHSEETKQKIRTTALGRKVTQETKEKLSIAMMGKSNGPMAEDTKEKIRKSLTGKSHPWQNKINKNPEKIAKTAAAHRGMIRSDEAKAKMSAAAKGRPAKNKGKCYINNPLTQERKYVEKGTILEMGWEYGYGKRK